MTAPLIGAVLLSIKIYSYTLITINKNYNERWFFLKKEKRLEQRLEPRRFYDFFEFFK